MMAAAQHLDWTEALAGCGKLLADEPMARHTTLAIGGPARWLFRPAGESELVRAMALIPAETPLLPLGRGSTMLIPDAGFEGLVLDLSALSRLAIAGHGATAGAGVRMGKLAQACANHGLTGLEFMATVPGDVGGGVAMNAGAFGQQVSDSLESLRILDRHGQVSELPAATLTMRYRHTALPTGAIVLAASFVLQAGEPEAIRERMRSMRARRSDTQPLAWPNCGSVFKNPEGDHAARLVEAAGLKGLAIGGARISEVHANFIVNDGSASAADVLALIEKAQQQVKARFGIVLEPEVRIVGQP
jgi:UDP-N-acetylmuramate dehydrogenase